jgi:hypothetical protein
VTLSTTSFTHPNWHTRCSQEAVSAWLAVSVAIRAPQILEVAAWLVCSILLLLYPKHQEIGCVEEVVVLQAVLQRQILVNRNKQTLESSNTDYIHISGCKHSEAYQCRIIRCTSQLLCGDHVLLPLTLNQQINCLSDFQDIRDRSSFTKICKASLIFMIISSASHTLLMGTTEYLPVFSYFVTDMNEIPYSCPDNFNE